MGSQNPRHGGMSVQVHPLRNLGGLGLNRDRANARASPRIEFNQSELTEAGIAVSMINYLGAWTTWLTISRRCPPS